MPSLHDRTHAGAAGDTTTLATPSIDLVHEHDVRHWFDDYARALTNGDGPSIAAMWDVPAILLSEQGVRSMANAEEIAKVFLGMRGMYALRGIVDTRPDLQLVEWLTERIVAVRVRWPLFDELHRELSAASSAYTLIRDRAGELKVRVMVMLGETEPLEH
jgi:hypothetical protein